MSAERLPDRARVLGFQIDRLDMQQTVARVEALIVEGVPSQHIAVSATNLVALREDERLREIAEGCAIVGADGWGVVWASKLLGDPLPERVTAPDLMERLLEVAERKGYRVFILGATEEALEGAVANIRRRYPRIVIAGYRNGYFGPEEDEQVVGEIRAAQPQMLFVAMPSPTKEYWLATHREALGVPFVMGVGGAVDVIAGLVRRAPPLIQRSGLEWAYRVMQEPRRLFRRFMVGNAKFLWLLGREVAARLAVKARS